MRRSREYGVRNTEYGVRNTEYGIRNTEYGVRNTEYGVGSAEMGKGLLADRTRAFALATMKLADKLPHNASGRVIQNQFLRCGTSVGANYRAAMRGKSPADCVAKLGIVEEEADESIYWMDLMVDGGLLPVNEVSELRKEADEILAMTVASIRTIKANHKKP